jgi:uncharacterized membrane protein YfcA
VPEFAIQTVVIASAALVLGGLVKGIIGFGLPIVAIAILTSFLPPTQALALVTIPVVITNVMQATQAGETLATLRRFWPMILFLVVTLWLTARVVTSFDTQTLFGLIGAAVILFAVTGVLKRVPDMPYNGERWLGPFMGCLAGFTGGVSTIWGPPVVIYLVMLKLSKDEFVRAAGVMWMCGSVPLLAGYLENGIINAETAPVSAVACIPAVLGFRAGQWARRFIDPQVFHKILLAALFLVGLNLVRRAFF